MFLVGLNDKTHSPEFKCVLIVKYGYLSDDLLPTYPEPESHIIYKNRNT